MFVPLEVIERDVCTHYEKPKDFLRSRSREKATAPVRHMFWALCLASGYAARQIGRIYGYDQSTIIEGANNARSRFSAVYEFLCSGLLEWHDEDAEEEPESKPVIVNAIGGLRGYHCGAPCIIDADFGNTLHIRVDGVPWIVSRDEVQVISR